MEVRMAKIRIRELADELNMSAEELKNELDRLNFFVKSDLTSISHAKGVVKERGSDKKS